jgi:hypothetical protein
MQCKGRVPRHFSGIEADETNHSRGLPGRISGVAPNVFHLCLE